MYVYVLLICDTEINQSIKKPSVDASSAIVYERVYMVDRNLGWGIIFCNNILNIAKILFGQVIDN